MSDALEAICIVFLVFTFLFAAPIIAFMRGQSCETRCAAQYGIKPEQENIDYTVFSPDCCCLVDGKMKVAR